VKLPLIIVGFNLLFLNWSEPRTFAYHLAKPDLQHELPEILNEVSGLTDIDASHVACVQDELGMVFIYNIKEGKITSEHLFEAAGDFEGLTYTGDTIFILRSDGRLTEWSDFQSNSNRFTHHELPLFTKDNEGLGYDPKHNRILIAAKSKPHRNHGEKSERFIYSFDLLQKAEGITFLHDGTMIITNEAGGKVPTLMVYKMEDNN
jgi:uncharacterized protein YjiK